MSNNYERARDLISDIWRGLATHPTTFGSCCHPKHEDRNHTSPARGGGWCVDCCAADLGEIVGGAAAANFVILAKSAKRAQASIEERAQELDK